MEWWHILLAIAVIALVIWLIVRRKGPPSSGSGTITPSGRSGGGFRHTQER